MQIAHAAIDFAFFSSVSADGSPEAIYRRTIKVLGRRMLDRSRTSARAA
jgi:hypothetical protein